MPREPYIYDRHSPSLPPAAPTATGCHHHTNLIGSSRHGFAYPIRGVHCGYSFYGSDGRTMAGSPPIEHRTRRLMPCNSCAAFRSTRRRDGRLPDQSILGRGFEASTVTARTMRWSPVLMLLLYCTETTSQNHGQPHTRPNAATLQRAQQKATLSPRSCSGPARPRSSF